MDELIKVSINENYEQVLSGRLLHEFLEVKERYTQWFKRMKEYGFSENSDYALVSEKSETNNPKNPYTTITDHIIKLDMAKELCMLQRNNKGKRARLYFIQLEKDYNSPEKTMARAVLLANTQIKELKPYAEFGKAIAETKDNILVGEFSKLLANDNIHIGEITLFKWLRNKGYLSRDKSTWNEPNDKYIKMGIFKVRISRVDMSGVERLKFTPLITGKGQKYLYEKIRSFYTERTSK